LLLKIVGFPCWFLLMQQYSSFDTVGSWQEGHPACKKLEWWGAGMVICLERGADLHMVPLPLTVSCFSIIQIGFTFLVPAHLGSPGKGLLNRCLFVCLLAMSSRKGPLNGCSFVCLFTSYDLVSICLFSSQTSIVSEWPNRPSCFCCIASFDLSYTMF